MSQSANYHNANYIESNLHKQMVNIHYYLQLQIKVFVIRIVESTIYNIISNLKYFVCINELMLFHGRFHLYEQMIAGDYLYCTITSC